MADKKKPIEPEVVPKGAAEEAKARIRGYSDSVKNPTAERYIDWAEFEKAAQRFLPLKDIAPLLGVHRNTLNNRCKEEFDLTSSEVWHFFASKGKRVLSSKLYDSAMGEFSVNKITGERKMLTSPSLQAQIWLSKNFLGMREPERQEPKTGGNAQPKEIVYKPTVRGIDGPVEEADIQKMMGRYLDLDMNHPLKQIKQETEKDEPDRE